VQTGGHAGWEQRATTDPNRIRRAWSTGPFNVGIATGPAGLVVVDVDTADPTTSRPNRGPRSASGTAPRYSPP
jgi:hypothetical protein